MHCKCMLSVWCAVTRTRRRYRALLLQFTPRGRCLAVLHKWRAFVRWQRTEQQVRDTHVPPHEHTVTWTPPHEHTVTCTCTSPNTPL